MIHCEDPVLHSPVAEIHPRMFTETDLVAKASQILTAQLMAFKAVGIAAPQMGLPYAMMVVPSKDDASEFLVACNPKLFENEEAAKGGKYQTGIEGCLSYPFIQTTICRRSNIDVEFLDIQGTPRSGSVDGFASVVWQHEYDHLLGVVMADRISKIAWEYAKEDGKKREKKYKRMLKQMPKIKEKENEQVSTD